MDTMTTLDRASATQAIAAAVTDAARAPSIHNTQPWRWRIEGDVADLYADGRRELREADPDRRLLVLSCGAALHQACVALAAAGIAAEVTRLADPDDNDHTAVPALIGKHPDFLASITVTGRMPITDAATRLNAAAATRQTDRRPLLDTPLPDTALTALRATAGTFGIGLHLLTRDQSIELASAMSRAQDGEIDDAVAHAELNAWTDPRRPPGAGVPDANIPDHTVPTTVPMRDFGHPGTLAVTPGHDNAASYVILYGLVRQ